MTKKISTAGKNIEIVLYQDDSCEMEKLVLVKDGKEHEFFESNAWDYHGADRYDAICDVLKELGIKHTAKVKKYTYND